ncbi:hypothetical protein FOZ62_011836 [Perkinsus olseni]|uniref:Major facilitator superfamily (MFS) profile domain-containing protein n=1 Tax=Perkinsus olseni TaxID=32597 RepID=A0A7J6S782_PEROL|nr:hypothetical protein FOZ62_011836 [Perkinsus olseni]
MVRSIPRRREVTAEIDFTYSALADVDEPLSPAGVGRKLDAMGFGSFQIAVLILCGGVLFSEGNQLMVMGPVAMLLGDHWSLPPLTRVLLASTIHLGYVCGCLLSGLIGDRLGRRPCVLMSYLLTGAFGFACSTASTEVVMLAYRFGAGVGCGLGIPAVFALLAEVSPSKHRAEGLIIMASLVVLGELYATAGILFVDPHLTRSGDHCDIYLLSVMQEAGHQVCSWRTLLEIAAAPSLFMVMFALTMLWESPQFVTVRHRDYQEVNRILKTVRKSNGAYNVPVRFTPDSSVVQEQPYTLRPTAAPRDVSAFATITGRHYSGTVWTLILVTACKDSSLYGLAYILPQYFRGVKGLSPGLQLVISASLAIPGAFLALLLGSYRGVGHVTVTQALGFLCTVCGLGMLQLSYMPDWMGPVSAYALRGLVLGYYAVVSTYTAEVFPTNCRTTAIGVISAIGRLGAVAAPLIFELSKQDSRQTLDAFITLLIVLMAAAMAASGINLIWETKGLPLVSVSPEESSAELDYTSQQRVAEAQALLGGSGRSDKRTTSSYSSAATSSCSIIQGA